MVNTIPHFSDREWGLLFMEVYSMEQQRSKRIKMPHLITPCILTIGILGIILGLIVTPEKFPTISLYLTGIGSIWSIVIPQNS